MPFPWHNAWCGDIDICGFKKPQSSYRDTLWGATNITMAVHTPMAPGRRELISRWGWPDESKTWTWPDSVRLELNDKVVGVQPVPKENKMAAYFRVPYQPGVLRATGLTAGKPAVAAVLATVGAPKKLRLSPDRATIHSSRNDLAYVTVEVVDDHGNLVPNAAVSVRFSVSGEGELAAVANSSPKDAYSFKAPACATYQGRCLAILRPKGAPGAIKLRAKTDGLDVAEISVKTQ